MSQLNAVGWFEIYVDDMARAIKFYETVMGKKLEEIPDPSGETQMMGFPTEENSYGSSGALVKMKEAGPGQGGTLVYFSTEDCAVQEGRLADAGGKVITSKFSIGENGFIAMGQDTEGNIIGFHSMK